MWSRLLDWILPSEPWTVAEALEPYESDVRIVQTEPSTHHVELAKVRTRAITPVPTVPCTCRPRFDEGADPNCYHHYPR